MLNLIIGLAFIAIFFILFIFLKSGYDVKKQQELEKAKDEKGINKKNS